MSQFIENTKGFYSYLWKHMLNYILFCFVLFCSILPALAALLPVTHWNNRDPCFSHYNILYLSMWIWINEIHSGVSPLKIKRRNVMRMLSPIYPCGSPRAAIIYRHLPHHLGAEWSTITPYHGSSGLQGGRGIRGAQRRRWRQRRSDSGAEERAQVSDDSCGTVILL